MKYIKITASDQDGKEIGYRIQPHLDEDMGASEYAIGLRAKELYRDYLEKEGLWEKRTGYGHRPNRTFWD